MKRVRGILGGAMLVVAMAVSSGAWADDQDVIDYRRHLMKAMGEEAAMLGMMVQQKVPAADFAAHAKALAVTASMIKKAFRPEIPGGRAKPEVWSNWGDFSNRVDTLVSASADLAKAAQEGGIASAGPKMKSLNCKACHDQYREPEK